VAGRSSIAGWFADNEAAQATVLQFIKDREAGDPTSVLDFLHRLQTEYGFPFTSEPSLVRHLKAHGMGRRVLVIEATPEDDGLASYCMTRSRARAIRKARRWVVTAAQNNTPVDAEFLKALETYAAENNAEIIVRPIRYKNPTSNIVPEHEVPDGMWWDPAMAQYLVDDEIETKDVVIPDVRIAATAANPLVGLDARSGLKHGVYGATQLAMKTVATLYENLPKILYSTGAVTVPNYSTTKSGNLAEFHHSMSAIIIEQDRRGRTFLRSVTWDGESFIDIDRQYTAHGSSERAPSWSALVTGDEHAWFVDPKVKEATYLSPDSMVAIGQPDFVVRHDVLDCYSISHHHDGNALIQRNKATFGWSNLRKELNDTLGYIEETTTTDFTNIIVSSNHNDHLSRWLSSGERGVTPENKLIYHELMVVMLASAERRDTGAAMVNPFEAYANQYYIGEDEIQFLSGKKAFMIHDIDVSQHGHSGPNGSRGSRNNLSKIGAKTVIGHSHSPGIVGGCWQVGTSSRMDLEYLSGPSSWLHCHCVIHANGKRQLLPIIDGKWRA